MNQDKMHLINKIFNNETIMTVIQKYKRLRKESLRDNMTRIEELLTDLGKSVITRENNLNFQCLDGKK